ncbi:hypothetical protein BcDW1_9273 [Botrytis cinerea BcDW1]|uniref:Uncharacterized protein n=1 Tax=Botryotinia fuckeliana (strain BcDW1) TaxID=1290391 RepID=M7UF72_BOTF1|nr:hypothetical protein BcDW1_9273 [Botrytis cinerea BcDW1]
MAEWKLLRISNAVTGLFFIFFILSMYIEYWLFNRGNTYPSVPGSSLSKSRYILRSVFNGLQSSGLLANLNYFFVVNEVRIGLLIVRLRNNQTAGSEPNTETSTGIAYVSSFIFIFDNIQSLLAYGPESRWQAVEEEKISNTIAILQSTAGAKQANNQTNNV